MSQGQSPLEAIEAVREIDAVVIAKPVWHTLMPEDYDLDAALEDLVRQGRIETVAPDVWLLISGKRPQYDVLRFWNNPDLNDPDEISTLVCGNPSLPDVTRTVIAYGTATVEKALAAIAMEGQVSPWVIDIVRRMIASTRLGLRDVAYGEHRDGGISINLLRSEPGFDDESFVATCKEMNGRPSSADLFKLWRFLAQGGRRVEDVMQAAAGDRYFNVERTKRHILPLYPPNDDPGFTPIATGPQNFAELVSALTVLVAAYERREAARTVIHSPFGQPPKAIPNTFPRPEATEQSELRFP